MELMFVVFPYLAAAVLVAGLVVRCVWSWPRVDALRAEAADAWALFRGGREWRVGLGATAVAHLAILLLPRTILSWNSAPLRLYLLEGTGLLFGLAALVGWGRVMWRHLGRAATATPTSAWIASEIADCALLSLLFMAIASGLIASARYRWGSSWAGATLTPYLRTLAVGAPAMSFVEKMPRLIRLHVVSLFALMMVLPLTRVALVAVVALNRALTFVDARLTEAARAARAAIGRTGLTLWLWPEEDALETMPDGAEPTTHPPADPGRKVSPANEGGIVYEPPTPTPRAPT